MDQQKNPPKLTLLAGKTYKLTLVYDEPKIGNGQFGTYYLYHVLQEDGNRYSWFASRTTHEKIEAGGFKQNDSFYITKNEVDEGGKVYTEYDVESTKQHEAGGQTILSGAPEAQKMTPESIQDAKPASNHYDDEKDRRIAKLSCISSAAKVVAAEIDATKIDIMPEQVVTYAELFMKYVEDKEK